MTRQQRIAVARYERAHPATHQAVEPMLSMQEAMYDAMQRSAVGPLYLPECSWACANPRELPA